MTNFLFRLYYLLLLRDFGSGDSGGGGGDANYLTDSAGDQLIDGAGNLLITN